MNIELDDDTNEIASAIADRQGKPVDEVVKSALLLLASRVILKSERKVA